MLDKRNFYINGEWVQPTTPNDLEVINPSNEENCAVISLGDKADVDKAVSAARSAYQSWSITPKEERISVLKKYTMFICQNMTMLRMPYLWKWALQYHLLKKNKQILEKYI